MQPDFVRAVVVGWPPFAVELLRWPKLIGFVGGEVREWQTDWCSFADFVAC